jgi:hypothetical protein
MLLMTAKWRCFMKTIVLKCIGCICITVLCYFLLAYEHAYLAAFVEITGLAIIFDAIVPIIEAIDDLLS